MGCSHKVKYGCMRDAYHKNLRDEQEDDDRAEQNVRKVHTECLWISIHSHTLASSKQTRQQCHHYGELDERREEGEKKGRGLYQRAFPIGSG